MNVHRLAMIRAAALEEWIPGADLMKKGRRNFLRSSLTAASAAAAAPLSAATPAKTQVQPPFRLIFETEWNDIPCADYPLTRERWVEECIHPMAGTQVDTIFYN